MKYTVLFFLSALTVIRIKNAQALEIDYMDTTFKTRIDLYEPSVGSMSSRILKSQFGISYTPNRNKTISVYAPFGYSILVSIRLIDLRPYGQDTLTISSVNREVSPVKYSNTGRIRNRQYDFREHLTFYAPNGAIFITFTTGPDYSTIGYDGFELTYTSQASSYKCNWGKDFRCNNGRCIAKILECDGHNHCGDQSSEKNCYIVPSSGRTIGITFGIIFLGIAIACGVFIVIRRARRAAADTTIISTHPPPTTNLPSYPPVYSQPGTYYPPPPPPYSQGSTNPSYH